MFAVGRLALVSFFALFLAACNSSENPEPQGIARLWMSFFKSTESNWVRMDLKAPVRVPCFLGAL